MVFILQAEFKSYEDDEEIEEAMTHFTLQPHQAVFEIHRSIGISSHCIRRDMLMESG